MVRFDGGDWRPCFGFMQTARGPYSGGNVKRVLYGLICNLNGLAFSGSEAAEILSRVHD